MNEYENFELDQATHDFLNYLLQRGHENVSKWVEHILTTYDIDIYLEKLSKDEAIQFGELLAEHGTLLAASNVTRLEHDREIALAILKAVIRIGFAIL